MPLYRSGSLAGVVLAALAIVTIAAGAGGPASRGATAGSIGSTPDRTWVTNGIVHAIARLGDTVYFGGQFSEVGPRTGPGVGIDAAGQADPAFPEVGAGALYAVVSDEAGGWYIGGRFASVGGL